MTNLQNKNYDITTRKKKQRIGRTRGLTKNHITEPSHSSYYFYQNALIGNRKLTQLNIVKNAVLPM